MIHYQPFIFRASMVLMFLFCAGAIASSQEDNLSLGNQAYSEGEYEKALGYYETIDSELGSFEYFYNLGNIHYKLGNFPWAILNYERAKKIAPLEDDLQHNLQMARQKIPDRIEELPSLSVEDFWTNLLATGNLSFWAWTCLVALFLGFGLLIYQLFASSSPLRRSLILAGSGFIVASIIFLLISASTYKRVQSNTMAILMKENVDLKGAPTDKGVIILMLHEGTKVWILQEQKEWFEIRIGNGSVGWIEKSGCEVI
jgi:tetratricopeptide (TPR) repeat protein